MAFGGTFGPTSQMIPIGLLTCPHGDLSYNLDGISVDLRINGQVATITQIAQINNLRIQGAFDQNAVLAAFVALGDGTTADRGTLTTGDPAAVANTFHGIPANFGPGRNNWTQDDIERLTVRIQAYLTGSLNDALTGQAAVQSVALTMGNPVITFRNLSLAACNGITIDLEYRHSINLS